MSSKIRGPSAADRSTHHPYLARIVRSQQVVVEDETIFFDGVGNHGPTAHLISTVGRVLDGIESNVELPD